MEGYFRVLLIAALSWASITSLEYDCYGHLSGVCRSPATCSEEFSSLCPKSGLCCPDSFETRADNLLRRVPKSGCKNRKCLRYYNGWWSRSCRGRSRRMFYCKAAKLHCCSSACRMKRGCRSRGGYCVSNPTRCPGTVYSNLCKGFSCHCCVPEADTTTSETMSTTMTSSTTPPTVTSSTTPPIVTERRTCECGQRNPVNKIVGGSPATQHEYPWQVALTSHYSNQPFCGGSIVSDQWIVTAALCVVWISASEICVVIGEHNWQSSTESTVHQRLTVARIIVHPNYNVNTTDNDIALLKLSSAITFPDDNKVAPVCLPTTQNDYSNVDAIITGWGETSYGGSQPNILYEVTVPTMTNAQCQNSYGNYSISIMITSNTICAGLSAGGKDFCWGDIGGPMVTANGNFYELIGVASWAFGCADPSYPGVYARVTNYLSFINGYISGSTTCPSP